MRYWLIIFGLFFLSNFSFAQVYQGTFCDSLAVCNSFISDLNARPNHNEWGDACVLQPNPPDYACSRIYLRCPSPTVNDPSDGTKCICPAGQKMYETEMGSTCGPASCPAGKKINISGGLGNLVAECIDDDTPSTPPDDCPADSMVYDPVSGTLVCPGSGDSSSSASSQNCVVPGDYDGDCVPDDQNSSAASSAPPASSAGSGASSTGGAGSSSGGGGDDDGPNTGGGGGSGPGTGGNTGGGGSASSVGAGSSSGSNNSWTPNSGYGNWIPVGPDSNCPNKYQDANGQWWCAGSTGSGSSAGAGQCDPTSKDYLSCISQQQTASSGGAGSSACTINSLNYAECSGKLGESETTIQQLGDKFSEDVDTLNDDFASALDDDLSNFERDGVPFADSVNFFKNRLLGFLPSPSSCIPPVFHFWGNNYELDCYLFDIFKQAVGWVLAIFTVFNVFQIATRPVDR